MGILSKLLWGSNVRDNGDEEKENVSRPEEKSRTRMISRMGTRGITRVGTTELSSRLRKEPSSRGDGGR